MSDEIIELGPFDAGPATDPVGAYLNGLANGSGRRSQTSALHSIAVLFGYRTAREVEWQRISAASIRTLRARLRSLYAGATCNRMLSALRGVLAFAHTTVPDDVKAALKDNEQLSGAQAGRALGPEELGKLFAAVRPTADGLRDGAMVAVMYGAGIRRDSVCKLDVEDWDATKGALTLRKAKGGKTYMAWLHSAMRPVLDRWLEIRLGDPGPMFPRIYKGQPTRSRMSVESVSAAIEELRVRAGVNPFTPHDLRRTFGTELLDSGVDISAAATLMGHNDPKTTKLYDRRAPERIGALVQKANLDPWRTK